MSADLSNETFRANVLAEIKSIQAELNQLKTLKRKTTKRKPARKRVTKSKRTAKRRR